MTLPNVYAWNYSKIIVCMISLKILWGILKKYVREDIWRKLNIAGVGIALVLILKYTVLGRAVTSEHRFVLAAAGSNEFFREMLMNCFLYFPFGLTLGEVQRRKVWSGAFFVSLLIEIWQFMAGTGVAQGTDLLCNTIGAVWGSGYSLENFGLSSILKKKRKDSEISKSNVEKNGKNSVEKDRKKEVRRW